METLKAIAAYASVVGYFAVLIGLACHAGNQPCDER